MTITQNIKIPADRRLTIDDVRQLLQKEMIEKGTYTVNASTGDGWEAHVRERYAES